MNVFLLIAISLQLVTCLVLDSSSDPLLVVEQQRQAILQLKEKVAEIETVVNRLDSSVNAECAIHCPSQKSVAFMAQLSSSLYNPATGHVVVFDDVITNVGNGYNNIHGIFKAPINGTYSFSLVASTPPGPNIHHIHLLLKLNAKDTGYVFFDDNLKYWFRRSTSIVLDMTRNDELWVEVAGVTGNHTLSGCCFHTHFSGFLIQAD